MQNFVSKYFEGLAQTALQYLLKNYDYCYLDAMHAKNRETGCRTIIAGSSHAMNGIVEEEMSGEAINFSISSQDVYFDFLNVRKAVGEGKKQIQNCVINIGYYMLYQDLSYSKTMRHLMSGVYGPLFGDTHNYAAEIKNILVEVNENYEGLYSGELLQMSGKEFVRAFFKQEGSYYGTLKSREQNSLLPLKGIVWQQLTEEEKEYYAQKRTADHNHLKKYRASREQNGKIVEEMIKFLYTKGIKPFFVIFPFTRHYNKYIDKDYRKDIYSLLEGLPLEVEFLDMNDFPDMFGDEDFLDTDHLNLTGAVKATRLLDEFMAMAGNKADGTGGII